MNCIHKQDNTTLEHIKEAKSTQHRLSMHKCREGISAAPDALDKSGRSPMMKNF